MTDFRQYEALTYVIVISSQQEMTYRNKGRHLWKKDMQITEIFITNNILIFLKEDSLNLSSVGK